MHFKDSVAIITGGASGLGEATVREFHLNGCKVFIFDKDTNKGTVLAQELGENAAFFPVDVCNTRNVQEAISKVVNKFQKITKNMVAELHILTNMKSVNDLTVLWYSFEIQFQW